MMMTQMMAAMRSSAAAAVAPCDVVVVVDVRNKVAVMATILVEPQCLGCPVAAWVDAEVDAMATTLRHGQMFV